MRRPSPPDEDAYQQALEQLRDAMSRPEPEDVDWVRDLPEAPPLPVAPDDVVAIVIPRVRR